MPKSPGFFQAGVGNHRKPAAPNSCKTTLALCKKQKDKKPSSQPLVLIFTPEILATGQGAQNLAGHYSPSPTWLATLSRKAARA